ncbi:MAG TPA: N-acetylmuramoyl-L-alanine amidase [Candidatus Sulfotelmatobacter sp.]|nr:N-acetylmuramoyl-L-alanine amidase [Candidatus Sulfotelmatobacter sp.]
MRAWPVAPEGASGVPADRPAPDPSNQESSPLDALQALLAFSVLHEQVRRRKALEAGHNRFNAGVQTAEFDEGEQFVLDEVLQLVAERALAITGADGLAIALAEDDEIVLRAAAGTVRPDVGARIDRDSAFSGACFRTAQIVNCDDTETDPRVNLHACQQLGARAMVAVPLFGRRRVIGVLEAFSSWPFAFSNSDIQNLNLLAELVVGALRPEDENSFAASAQIAATKLESGQPAPTAMPAAEVAAAVEPPQTIHSEPAAVALDAEPEEAEFVPAIPHDFATDTAEHLESEEPFQNAIPAGLEPAHKAPLRATRRRRLLSALLLLVVVAGAAAIWWKMHNGQQSGTTAPSQVAQKSSVPGVETKAAAASPSVASTQAKSGAPRATRSPDALHASATLTDLSKFPQVTGIEHSSAPDSTTVVVDLEGQVQYEEHQLAAPDRVYFDLHDTQLAPGLAGKSITVGDSLLRRIRVAQPVAGVTRVVLETARGVTLSPLRVNLELNPYRLVIEMRKAGAENKGTGPPIPAAEVERNKLAIEVPPPAQPDLQRRAPMAKMRIVVDAGHGGWDLGTVGRGGLIEKEVVLEIAQRVGRLLESRLGANVILTRTGDNYIPLAERAEIANQAQADLFISVHANYSDLASARGVETYYASSLAAPASKDHADRSNSSRAKARAASLSPADLEERIKQSRRLAASVQRALYASLSAQSPGLPDRGIKPAGFEVLTESAMPGIVAEVSFVSSPTDERKLRVDSYREQIAEALFQGIAQYAAASREVKVASAGR